MDRGDYRLLPKGLRRMLVFSETFFFREYVKDKTPKKPRREEAPPPRWRSARSGHMDQPSLCRASAWQAISGMPTRQARTWQSARTFVANTCVPDEGKWCMPTALRRPLQAATIARVVQREVVVHRQVPPYKRSSTR
jgi:hypothetical protein